MKPTSDKEVPATSFFNPEIQKAIDSLSPALISYHADLDKISSDIKELESYLQRQGINIDAGLCFDDNETTLGRLEWSFDEKSKKHRINYAVYRARKSEYRKNNNIAGRDISILKKKIPLIEAPVDIRVTAATHLPDLLEMIQCRIEGLKDLEVPRGD